MHKGENRCSCMHWVKMRDLLLQVNLKGKKKKRKNDYWNFGSFKYKVVLNIIYIKENDEERILSVFSTYRRMSMIYICSTVILGFFIFCFLVLFNEAVGHSLLLYIQLSKKKNVFNHFNYVFLCMLPLTNTISILII